MRISQWLRRSMVLATVSAAGLAGVAIPAPVAAQSPLPPAIAPADGAKPNILFVLVDDMGFGDLSVMGNRKVATPNIDRLAQNDARGIDLTPVLSGREIAERPALFWAYGKEGAVDQPNLSPNPRDVSPRFAVRDGDWKLLMNAGGADLQLYDLAADPNETSDLAAKQPAIRERLKAKLRGWMSGLPK
jgi:arylsulfatase A-like enzyme